MTQVTDSLDRISKRLSQLEPAIDSLKTASTSPTSALRIALDGYDSQLQRIRSAASELRHRLWQIADNFLEFELQISSSYIQTLAKDALAKHPIAGLKINRITALPASTEDFPLPCLSTLPDDVIDVLIDGTVLVDGVSFPVHVHVGMFLAFEKYDKGRLSIIHGPHICEPSVLRQEALEPMLASCRSQIEQGLDAISIPAAIPTHLPGGLPGTADGTELDVTCARRFDAHVSILGQFPVYVSDVVQVVVGIPPMQNDLAEFKRADRMLRDADVCLRISTYTVGAYARRYMPDNKYNGSTYISPPGFTIMADPNDKNRKVLVAGITAAAFFKVCSRVHIFPITNMHCDYSTESLKTTLSCFARFIPRVTGQSGFVDVQIVSAWNMQSVKSMTLPLGTGIQSVDTDVSADAINIFIRFADENGH